MTKSNPKLQLQTLKEVAVCSQYVSINARLNSKAKSGIIYSSPVTFKLSNSSIYILICAHSSGKPVISVFTTYDNKILHTQLSEPSFAKIEVSGMNVIVTAQYTHIYSLVKVS